MPFTVDQLRAGFVRNAASLTRMLVKAEHTGRRVNGFTADYLRDRVHEYEHLSRATDDEIRAHVAHLARV